MNELKLVSSKIDLRIRNSPWMDFEIEKYINDKLTIIGGISLLQKIDLKICFHNIFFMNLTKEWKTDTSREVFSMLDGKEFRDLNISYMVEQGYNTFRFKPENSGPGQYNLICSKFISFEEFE